ncbi:MAG: non-ribosomal peptide synthetase, partial [bacterium]|nr:non-ribosomal peptide synthetase [bacterium]
GIIPSDIVYALTTYTFDISVLELIGSLLSGTSVVVESSTEDVEAAGRNIVKHNVSVLQATPSRLGLMVDILGTSFLSAVKVLLVGGESLPQPLWDTLAQLSSIRVYNVYGPTEATIWSTAKQLDNGRLSIGSPLLNETVFILSDTGRLVPVGVNGQLCIAGTGVGRGYLNRPELTHEKFDVKERSELYDGAKPHHNFALRTSHFALYRTGDLAHWMPDGNIEFIGRMDTQVKIRGFRIELGEIENQLLGHEKIKEAVVMVEKDSSGAPFISAYIVSHRDQEISLSHLREFLSLRLPHYMIPAHFIRLQHLPLNFSGKVDRQALKTAGVRLSTDVRFLPPSTDTEKMIGDIWKEILGLDRVGINDNFFDQGGNSLKVVYMGNRLKELSGKDVPVAKLFAHPTIVSLARYLDTSDNAPSADDAKIDRSQVIDRGRKSREKRAGRRKLKN